MIKINDYQKNRIAQRLVELLPARIDTPSIALLGWAFKKNTNDSRESAAIYIAAHLLEKGIQVKVYDPMVTPQRMYMDLNMLFEAQNKSKKQVQELLDLFYVEKSIDAALEQTQVAGIVTEWDEFAQFNWKTYLKNCSSTYSLLDGRSLINKEISPKIHRIGN